MKISIIVLSFLLLTTSASFAEKVVVIPLNSTGPCCVPLNQICPGHSVMIGIDASGNIICNDFKYVFVTSTTHSGILGGLTGADTICQDLATSAGLPGTYMAWLSDRIDSPSTRFTQYNDRRYILTNGTTIADNWTDLTDGSINAPISINENQDTVQESGVWTNTNADGTRYSQWDPNNYYDCGNWTTTSGTGARGHTGYTDTNWSHQSSVIACFTSYPIYCFQQ